MADPSSFDNEENESLARQALSLVLAPVHLLTSRTAIKAYLSTLLFLATSTVLLAISSFAYGFFYYNYIPQINLERVMYLQYGQGPHPHATTALDTSALVSQQAYDVELILDMPRTPKNVDAGNFMLDLSLLGPGVHAKNIPDPVSAWLANITSENLLYHSRRPATLPYASPILSVSHMLLNLPWHLLNFRDLDSSHLVVPMFEKLSFPRGSRNVPTHARLEIQSSTILQVYDAKLAFRAKFQGLRYLIYNYRVTAFVIFTALFYTVSVTSMALAWALISNLLSSGEKPDGESGRIKQESRDDNLHVKPERDSGSGTKVKTEDDTESSTHGLSLSNISDTATQFPPGRGPMPLTYSNRATTAEGRGDHAPEDDWTRPMGPDEAADDEDEDDDAEEIHDRRLDGDSGIGTSMESEHTASGPVRRRSSRGFSNR
ncbi:uncharacterized protein Z518_06530 [Rhinocladiella mackenziei CBS 650.93]|uniref:Seipin n=1 Tax=Rhinocladiella mackenziei CBS 650.93 TaxID=1442369 RepID=A0A0D2J257_9EURO|nr:uncharacterized protein Z518_06530 [Rhinocladiella mackenziei CBS 650.93]KIX02980.1 hypothetical protein Z518_06530 [Rhinocladiella mackenziei CBS 650.93]